MPRAADEHPHDDMLTIYRDQVDDEHVLQTKDSGTLVLTVTGEGTYELAPDASYAEQYGWDDDDGEANSSDPSGDGSTGRSRRRPATPPPGYEKTPQRPPRRERYAHA